MAKKKECDCTTTLTTELINAIDRHSAAIKYAADKIGFALDKIYPEAAAEITIDPLPFVKDEKVTIEQVKEALNAYARKTSKDEALALVEKYAGSYNPAEIPEDKFIEVLKDAA